MITTLVVDFLAYFRIFIQTKSKVISRLELENTGMKRIKISFFQELLQSL